jgi:ATP-dependent RNA helicase RhlE
VPEDYIHRVGRTGRADQVGDAFTLVAPEDEGDLTRIERAVGRKIPRVMLEDFDYSAAAEAPLEVPIKERIAAIRARKAEERARAAAKAARAASAGHAPSAKRPATAGAQRHGNAAARPSHGQRRESGRPRRGRP